jgi:hypothetical protein
MEGMKTYSHIITLTSFLLFSCGGGGIDESNGDANATEDQNSSIISSDQNGSRVVIVTTTSDIPHSGSDDLGLYAHIIGIDESRIDVGLLDNVGVNDLEKGQTSTFSMPFDYPVSKIKGIELTVKGEDAWRAETISFQFFESGKNSEPYSFEVNQNFSAEKKDLEESGAVESKLFSFRPELK